MEATGRTLRIRDTIDAFCAGDACRALWRCRSREILHALLNDPLLDQAAGAPEVGMKEALAAAREAGCLDGALYGALMTGTGPGFPREACARFLLNQYRGPDDASAPWARLVLLRCAALAADMPRQTCPSEEALAGICSDGLKASSLMERLSPFIPFAFALARLDAFAANAGLFVSRCGRGGEVLAGNAADGPGAIAEADGRLKDLARLRRSFMRYVRWLRARLIPLAERGQTPQLSACLEASGMAFAIGLRNRMEAVRREVLQACVAMIPEESGAGALRALLDRIRPPLTAHDRSLAEEEIARIDDGGLDAARSPLLAVVIPALRGEREIDDRIYEAFPDFPYSAGLVRKIMLHACVLEESPGTPGPEPEASPAPGALEDGIGQFIAGASLSLPSCDGRTDIEGLVRDLVAGQDSCALCWLARTLGADSPFPVWLAELIHLGTHFQAVTAGPGDEISRLCVTASAGMDGLDDRQKLLLAAALLRPALMAPDPSTAAVVASLSSGLDEEWRLGEFMNGLCRVMRDPELPEDTPSPDVMDVMSDARTRQRWFLRQETESLIRRARGGVDCLRSDTALKWRLFQPDGQVGQYLHAAMNGEVRGLQKALGGALDVGGIRTLLIREKIDDAARKGILDDVALAIGLIRKWLALNGATGGGGRPLSGERMENLRGILEKSRRRLECLPEGRWFLRAMDELDRLTPAGGLSPARDLELWPLRLPFSSPGEETVFDREPLLHALRVRDFDGPGAVAASLAVHAALGRTALVREFLDRFPDFRDAAPSSATLERFAPTLARALPFSIDDCMDASLSLWRQAYEEERDDLEEELDDSCFRGAIGYGRRCLMRGRISEIDARCGGMSDRAPGMRELRALRDGLQVRDRSGLRKVKDRIADLRKQAASSPQERRFLEALRKDVVESHIFSAAWDGIARLEAWRRKPGELPGPAVKRADALAVVRWFYGSGGCRWAGRADSSAVRCWNSVVEWNPERASEPGFPDPDFTGAVSRLLSWLGFSLSGDAPLETVFTGGRPHFWTVLRGGMTISSPFPQWGSGAGGRHTIAIGWDVTPTGISNLVTSGRIGEGEALTIVCCNALAFEQRKEMLRLSHRGWPVFPLVIDATLFDFIAFQNEADRTERLFEVALAGSPCNPYAPDAAGAVPREMFFGREAERSGIMDADGPCIVCGGRQTGKSALLEQICREHGSGGDSGAIIVRHTMTMRDTSLLDAVIRCCADAGVVAPCTTSDAFARDVSRWLHSNPGRRLLVLLDECDGAIDEDARRGFHDVEALRELMQASRRRFKVVFAGLHSVLRFSLTPDRRRLSPRGDPIRLGPLTLDAARELMTRPMRFLGLEFESPELVHMAISRCCRQPGLMRMLCGELVRSIGEGTCRDPAHVIDRDAVLKVLDSPDMKDRAGRWLSMTLSLDGRYLAIGCAMALLQGERTSLGRLQRALRECWPAAFAGEGGSVVTLRRLLLEMEHLGLVISADDGCRLRLPDAVELLGGRESIHLMLEGFHDMPFQPEADPDDHRMENSVFVASQHSLLSDRTNRLCWISGSPALELDGVDRSLLFIKEQVSELHRGPLKYVELDARSVNEAMQSLRDRYDSLSEGGLIVTLSSVTCPHMATFMKKAEKWLGQLLPDGRYVKVVCIVTPECLYELIKTGAAERFSSCQMPLRPWTEKSLEYRCGDIAGPDPRAIMAETGGWPRLVTERLNRGWMKPKAVRLQPGDFIPGDSGLAAIVRCLHRRGDGPFPEEDITPELLGRGRRMNEAALQSCLDTLKSLHVLRETPEGLALETTAARIICGERA